MKKILSDKNIITSFTNNYDFLSNSFNNPITYKGLTYTCAGSAYWSQRVKDEKAKIKYTRLNHNKARAKALQAIPIDNWEQNRMNIMKDILKVKFSDPVLKKALLDTKDAKLLNNTSYNDQYWGIYYEKGQNRLGKLLEEIRSELK